MDGWVQKRKGERIKEKYVKSEQWMKQQMESPLTWGTILFPTPHASLKEKHNDVDPRGRVRLLADKIEFRERDRALLCLCHKPTLLFLLWPAWLKTPTFTFPWASSFNGPWPYCLPVHWVVYPHSYWKSRECYANVVRRFPLRNPWMKWKTLSEGHQWSIVHLLLGTVLSQQTKWLPVGALS